MNSPFLTEADPDEPGLTRAAFQIHTTIHHRHRGRNAARTPRMRAIWWRVVVVVVQTERHRAAGGLNCTWPPAKAGQTGRREGWVLNSKYHTLSLCYLIANMLRQSGYRKRWFWGRFSFFIINTVWLGWFVRSVKENDIKTNDIRYKRSYLFIPNSTGGVSHHCRRTTTPQVTSTPTTTCGHSVHLC